jgi:hypothetical protein
MSPNPPPRPALTRARDADVHPAAPGVPSLTTRLPHPSTLKAGGGAKGKTHKGKKSVVSEDGKTVDLVVPLPKSLRKRLKDKAADHGYTPEEAAYHLLRVWVDG